MEKTENPNTLGKYKIIRALGKGGMGEVLLAFDPTSERQVAIKRIRPDLVHHEVIAKRFLKEAKITASLYHPSIIPVYSIHSSENELYYVMPYVEGESLKNILRQTIQREKNHETPHPIGVSISALINIFINVCQAVSYCHSRGILHRDLKPENILVGNFGQVLLVDWGLAAHGGDPEEVPLDIPSQRGLTRPGKVLGTLSYMPPERADGSPADIYTDIYSLGVILYQILTLKMPFHRTTIKEFKKTRDQEVLIDPISANPNRDIPPHLAHVARRCLAKDPRTRYASVFELLNDLEKHRRGLPDWVFAADLRVDDEKDWELQENVLLSKLIPITRSTAIMQWYMLMISRESFSGNKKLEIALSLHDNTEGVGFLLNVPEAKEREGLEDGYCLWIGSKKNPGIKLYRSHVALVDLSDRYLEANQTFLIEIEKMDQNVRLSINHELLINYTDPLPIVGTHVGILSQDMEFSIHVFKVYSGSQNATIGCLSIPDAFLASKNFEEAYKEYIRIADSFKGRPEERDALFRSGITLMEKAKHESTELLRKALLEQALVQFDKLHHTLSEPLEYLGKSLVYRRMDLPEEELKCLELGVRKFKKHTLIGLLEERIIFRLHESAKSDRIGVYEFALLTLRHLPHTLSNRETHALIHNLSTYSEKLYFFPPLKQLTRLKDLYQQMAIQLAFWLDKPLILREMLEEETVPPLQENIQCALIALGYDTPPLTDPRHHLLQIERHLTRASAKQALTWIREFRDPSFQTHLDIMEVWALLLLNHPQQAYEILSRYPYERTDSPFHMLYGCYLAHTRGEEIAAQHFSRIPDYVYPPLNSLLAQSLKKNSAAHQRFHKQAFTYEKKTLLRQQILYYHCLGEKAKAAYWERKFQNERGLPLKT